jgi:hypothetical protein
VKSELILREANPSDSTELNRFFSSIPIQGFLDIKIRRQIDFFSLFHRLGKQSITYILEKLDSEILGTATFIFLNRICGQQPLKIALGCDLRISSQRRAILSWGQYFLPQIKILLNSEKLDHIVTSINLSESQVINAFIRPKITRTDRPIYELVQKYNLVTVHGFYPLQFVQNQNIQILKNIGPGKDKLITYLTSKLKNLELVPAEYLEDLESAIHKSLLYSWNQFIVATNSKGDIVGCTHPISSSLLQDYLPQMYNQRAHNFRQFLKVSSFLGFGRKLTKPFSSTNKEQTLNFRILHFLFFDHPDILPSLVHNAYTESKNNEFLIYGYQSENFAYRPPKGTIHTVLPHALYEIKPQNSTSVGLKNKIRKFILLDNLWF